MEEGDPFKKKVLFEYRKDRLFLVIVLIIGSLSIGLLAAPFVLNYYIENNIENTHPVYNGTIELNHQYLVKGTFYGYDSMGSYAAVITDYGKMEISLLPFKNRVGYQICSHSQGDKIKYVVLANGTPSGYGRISFILMREIC